MVHKGHVLDKLRKQVKLSGTVSHWARMNDVSPQYVHDVLSSRRDPGKKILDALGYSTVKTYVKIDGPVGGKNGKDRKGSSSDR